MLPIREEITFDFGSGNVSMAVLNANGKIIGQSDITNDLEKWKSSMSYELLAKNTLVRRDLFRLFRNALGTVKLPFSPLTATPLAFVEMTRFQGYPAAFFDAIPYDVNTPGHLDESFMAEKLRDAHMLPKVYEEIGLPAMKSIRRAVFGDVSLAWYLPEIMLLFHALDRDPNILMRFLEYPRIHEVLGAIHDSPGVVEFFAVYINSRGVYSLLKLFREHLKRTISYARCYSTLFSHARKKEYEKWREDFFHWGEDSIFNKQLANYSVPMGRLDSEERMCERDIGSSKIGQYVFRRLRNSAEYYAASRTLNNCLATYTPDTYPVYGIFQGEEIVGAVQVLSFYVLQARLKDNVPIEADASIYRAYKRWCNDNLLQTEYHGDLFGPGFDEDDFELNF